MVVCANSIEVVYPDPIMVLSILWYSCQPYRGHVCQFFRSRVRQPFRGRVSPMVVVCVNPIVAVSIVSFSCQPYHGHVNSVVDVPILS